MAPNKNAPPSSEVMGMCNVEVLCSFEACASCLQLNPLFMFPHARDDLRGSGSELSLSLWVRGKSF